MEPAALGTRTIRRPQSPIRRDNDHMNGYYAEGLDMGAVQQPAATPLRHRNISSRASDAENDWYAYQDADGRPEKRGVVQRIPPDGNVGQYEATNKVQLDRNLSVRSEICISPSWSRSEERSKRKKELKRLAKEQKALEKKLKREAKGKPREPRRLTKAGPSSRASSSVSYRPRFSSASSIRSFWSNRTSRAGSTCDPGEFDTPSTSHADGLSKRYKFLGVFPRRVSGVSGSEHRSKPQPDPPAPTLHTARKVFDLRASAKAFEQKPPFAQDSYRQEENRAARLTREAAASWTGDSLTERYQFPPPEKRIIEASSIQDMDGPMKEIHRPIVPPNGAGMDYFRLPKNNEVPDTQITNPVPSRRPEVSHSRRQIREENKPGNLIGSDFSRKSPLDHLAANAASLIAERDQTPATHLEHPQTTDPSSTKAVKDEGLTDVEAPNGAPKCDIDVDQTKGFRNDIHNVEESTIAFEGEPGPSVLTPIPQPDLRPVFSISGAPSIEPKPTPKSTPPVSLKPSPMSKSEALPSSPLAAIPLSAHAKANNKVSEYRPKPTVTYVRDPNFQSSPLAGPPLVVQDTIDITEPVSPGVPEKDEPPVPRRPAKLRRRSASVTGAITSSHATTGLGTYFPRLWRSGKKETKVSNDEDLQNGGDKERENIRQGKRPVRVVNGNGDDSSLQSQSNLANGTGKPAMNASAPVLSSPSTSINSKRPSMHSRRTASETLHQLRIPPRNVDSNKRPFTINLPSRGKAGSVYLVNGTGTPSLQDLIDDEALMTSKGASYAARGRNSNSSTVLSNGGLGQRTNKSGIQKGQPIAKMFVICCRCKFWHDMPSEAYANLAFHQGGAPLPDASSSAKARLNGTNPNKGKAPENSSIPTNMNQTSMKPGDRSRSTSRPAMTRDGVLVSTSINCCWCNHTMARACCSGWTAIVNLHEKHH